MKPFSAIAFYLPNSTEPDGIIVTTGFSYVGRRSKRHAELAAVCDGLLQQEEWHDKVNTRVVQPLQNIIQAKQNQQQRQTEATKVEFFTMLRGE